MEQAAYFYFFADRFGWTQRQTLQQNQDWLLQRLPAVAALVDELKAEKVDRK